MLFRTDLGHAVSKISTESDRAVGITIELIERRFLTIWGVYLPSTNVCNEEFREHVDVLHSAYQCHSQYSEVIMIGDWNCSLKDQINSCSINARSRYVEDMLKELNVFSLMTSYKIR